jgi:hypothetical protein
MHNGRVDDLLWLNYKLRSFPQYYLHKSPERPHPDNTATLLQQSFNTPSIMRSVLPFTLGLAWLAQAAVIPNLGTELAARDAEVTTEATTGYRSVAYFVNWVSLLHVGCIDSTGFDPLTPNPGNLRPELPASKPPCRQAHPCPVFLCQCPLFHWRGLSVGHLCRY